MSDLDSTARLPPGTEACGCCDGVAAATPRGIFNRSGLNAIGYRIGEYADFRDSLLAGLSAKDLPALAGLRTRDADDWTIALFDAVACAADVLTFYQERIANESFLRTATERLSLQEMGQLVGYTLRPAVAAETALSFALEAPRLPPAGGSADPGAFVTGIPLATALPAGLKVQSVPGPDEAPQTFETVEPLLARPEWNAVRPWLSTRRAAGRGATETWLQGVAANLKPGDAVLFVGAEFAARPTTDNHWDFRLLDAVDPDAANDRTRLRWRRPLGARWPLSNPPAAPELYVLRKRCAVFGHNAPMWLSLNAQFRADYPGGSADKAAVAEWPAFTIAPAAWPAGAAGGHVDLDAVQPGAAPGGYAVLAKGEFNRPDEHFPAGTYVELYQVAGVAEASRAEFALAGKVTRLALRGQNLDALFYGCVRETSVWVQSERLPLGPVPVDDAVAGDQLPLALPFAAAPAGLLPGRRLIVNGRTLAGADGAGGGVALAHEATVVAAAAHPDGTLLTITPPLPLPLARDTVVMHANVARASHGETVAQILGAGDAAQPFQRFELKRLPLTYRGAANESGAASTVTIRVGEVEWTERPTLFGAAPNDRVYTLTTDEAGRLWVGFGDGVRGARLPSGVNNVRATYRTGSGRAGNVGADRLTQLLSRPLGLKGVANPLPAQGGSDAEDAGQARRSIPLGTRTLGRAVSLLDYEDFALAFSGIAKAQAQVLTVGAGTTIAITVAGQDGDPLPADSPLRDRLLAALKNGGDPHVGVTLLSYQPRAFRLGLQVKRDPAYAAAPLLVAVEAELRARFGFDARALGQPVLASDVIATVHAVPGVVAVDLDVLDGGSAAAAPTRPALGSRLLAARMRVDHGVARPAELLTLAAGPLARLQEMA